MGCLLHDKWQPSLIHQAVLCFCAAGADGKVKIKNLTRCWAFTLAGIQDKAGQLWVEGSREEYVCIQKSTEQRKHFNFITSCLANRRKKLITGVFSSMWPTHISSFSSMQINRHIFSTCPSSAEEDTHFNLLPLLSSSLPPKAIAHSRFSSFSL